MNKNERYPEMADHGDAVARQEFEVPKIVFELDSKVYHGLMPVSEALEMAYREAYQAGSADRWVSAEEKLPGDTGDYLCARITDADFYTVTIATYVNDGLGNVSGWACEAKGLTHWMPLPAPPKKEDSHE